MTFHRTEEEIANGLDLSKDNQPRVRLQFLLFCEHRKQSDFAVQQLIDNRIAVERAKKNGWWDSWQKTCELHRSYNAPTSSNTTEPKVVPIQILPPQPGFFGRLRKALIA